MKENFSGKPLAVHIENLSVYYGQNLALEHVYLDVPCGEYLGVIGPNGGGKTTLIKAILGLVTIAYGTVQVYGGGINKNRGLIGYVPQFADINRSFPISLIEVVLTGCLKPGFFPFHKFSPGDKDLAYSMLECVGIAKLADRQISKLSGGEFQKMLIARALAANPQLLLLDEPTASVDAASREQIYSLLSELNKRLTVILVTHDLLAVSSHVKRLACLNKHLYYHGEPELNNNVLHSLYGCPVDLIAHGVPHRVLGDHSEGKNA